MTDVFSVFEKLPQAGEVLSITSAIVWASSVILFRVVGRRIHALGLNLFKNVLSFLLLGLTMVVTRDSVFPAIPAGRYVLFFLSGVLGIAVSDWLFLVALHKLGAELTAIVDCAYSPFVIGLSFLFLDEKMNPIQTLGVVLIVAAVLLITLRKGDSQISRPNLTAGIGVGILAMFFTAAGIVMIKPILGEASLIWAGFVRMAGGAGAAALLVGFHPRRRTILTPRIYRENVKVLVPASILASYVSMELWMAGMKYTQASIASALNQLNTIFIFILAAIFLKEKASPVKLAAIAMAFAGAFFVSYPL
jgi:drug/metabolite transporter (DMT)-like permease